eukprot:SAG11_NODE_87_length_17256_cov_15.295156_7_plen_67_part_00
MGKADKLINKISECQRELKKIQDTCTHHKKEVKFVNPKEGVRWVCKECQSLLGWPNHFEIEKWSNK